ncbi:MAG: DUF1559 domain-containing protein [Planctomycetaceae bacterium]
MSHTRARAGDESHPMVSGATRIRDISDGTSNTIGVFELASRNAIYKLRVKDTDFGIRFNSGGLWMDLYKGNTASQVRGTLYDGEDTPGPARGGPCGINCKNTPQAGMYSWHVGGVNAMLTDGSVRFISQDTDSANIVRALLIGDGKVQGEW